MAFWKHLPAAAAFGIGEHAIHKAYKKLTKSSAFSGSKGGLEKYKTMTHGEKKVYKDILSRINPKALDLMKSPLFKQSQKYIQNFLKQSPDQQYAAFEKPIMSQFNQQVVPEISTRFAGLGGLSSSGFQQSLGAAGSNLSERLGMLREGLKSNYQQQQLQAAGMGANMAQLPVSNMQNMINQAFATPSFGYQNQQSQPGFMQNLAGGIGQALPYAAMWALA